MKDKKPNNVKIGDFIKDKDVEEAFKAQWNDYCSLRSCLDEILTREIPFLYSNHFKFDANAGEIGSLPDIRDNLSEISKESGLLSKINTKSNDNYYYLLRCGVAKIFDKFSFEIPFGKKSNLTNKLLKELNNHLLKRLNKTMIFGQNIFAMSQDSCIKKLFNSNKEAFNWVLGYCIQDVVNHEAFYSVKYSGIGATVDGTMDPRQQMQKQRQLKQQQQHRFSSSNVYASRNSVFNEPSMIRWFIINRLNLLLYLVFKFIKTGDGDSSGDYKGEIGKLCEMAGVDIKYIKDIRPFFEFLWDFSIYIVCMPFEKNYEAFYISQFLKWNDLIYNFEKNVKNNLYFSTILHTATTRNMLFYCKLLVSHGFDINQTDRLGARGTTPYEYSLKGKERAPIKEYYDSILNNRVELSKRLG